MGMGFSSRKNPKMPGAHEIGAAVSGPRIAGGKHGREALSEKMTLVRQGHPRVQVEPRPTSTSPSGAEKESSTQVLCWVRAA